MMMMLYNSGWGTETDFHPTFKMLPITQECPFNEILFDPQSKILAIVGKEKKQSFRMLQKLNDSGKPVIKMDRGVQVEVQERKIMENFYEYYLEEREDIEFFINKFAINSKEFNWMSYLDKKES